MLIALFAKDTRIPRLNEQSTISSSSLRANRWRILSRPEEWNCPTLRRDLQGLVDDSDNLNAMYRSPVWFDHLQSMDEQEQLAPAVARDPSERDVGVAPLRLARSSLDFDVAGNKLCSFSILKVFSLGGGPLGPQDPAPLDALFQSILDAFPLADGIGFSAVQAGSFLWKYLFDSPFLAKHFFPYSINGIHEYHVKHLPFTFAEYLAQFDSKKRYNMKRQVRLLREFGGGEPELRRIETPEDLPFYHDALARLGNIKHPVDSSACLCSPLSRDYRLRRSIAERSLLRSYILRCGGEIVGCIRGTQYQGRYLIDSIQYRPDYARFSPGVVMLYLGIMDLLTHRPPRLISFGFGEPDRKHYHANLILDYGSVILFRKTLAHRVRWMSHRSLSSTVRWVKAAVHSWKRRWGPTAGANPGGVQGVPLAAGTEHE